MSNKACMYSRDCHSVVLRPFPRVGLPSGFFFFFFLASGHSLTILVSGHIGHNAFRFENIFVLYLAVSSIFTTHSFGLSSLFFFNSLKAIVHSLLPWLVLDERYLSSLLWLLLMQHLPPPPYSWYFSFITGFDWFYNGILVYPSCVLAWSLLSVIELQH